MLQLTVLTVTLVAGVLAKTDNIAPLLDNSLDDDIPPSELAFDGGKASVKCDNGFFEVELNFTQPFSGIVFAVNSSCQVKGNGTHMVRLNLLYNETCGTRMESGEFSNDISFRYNPIFETSRITLLTVKCSYGEPSVIPSLPLKINRPTTPSPLTAAAPLKTLPSLMILCTILFLSLLLIGLLSSYYILKRRRFQVVSRLPPSTGMGSEISKLSDSNFDNLSTYEELSIPRSKFILPTERHPGSDGESYPSGYISESPRSGHTSIYDTSRVLRRSVSSDSRENKVIVHSEPKYNDWVNFPNSPISGTRLASKADAVMNMQEDHLINYLEQNDSNKLLKSFIESRDSGLNDHHFSVKETIQPVYSEIMKHNTSDIKNHPEFINLTKTLPSNTIDSEVEDSRRTSEDYVRLKRNNKPYNVSETYNEDTDLPVVASRRPEVTTSIIEDVFLKTIIEKKNIEEIEQRKKWQLEPKANAQSLGSNWNVTIKNYPNPNTHHPKNEETTDWDSFSETSSMSSNFQPKHNLMHHNDMHIQPNYRSLIEIPVQDPSVKNWDVLIRVLQLPQTATKPEIHDSYRVEHVLTLEDRLKWRDIIAINSTLRNLLSKASEKEDFEMIRNDQRYEALFEPKKWDEIIQILVPSKRFITEEGVTRNRMGSLSTVYEYDSDGTLTEQAADVDHHSGDDIILRSRRTSRSSLRSNVRSVGELTVNHALLTTPDNTNDKSMYF